VVKTGRKEQFHHPLAFILVLNELEFTVTKSPVLNSPVEPKGDLKRTAAGGLLSLLPRPL
jgi:hypothetical protein